MRVLRARTHVISSATAGLLLLAQSWVRYFVTGQSVLGRDTDNASFWHAATIDHRKKPIERLTGPLWQRLARRWVLIGMPVFLSGFVFPLSWTVSTAYALAPNRTRADVPPIFAVDWIRWAAVWEVAAVAASLGWAVRFAVVSLRDRKRTNEFVYPAWQAACGTLGIVYHRRDARRMVILPDDFEPTSEVDEPSGHRFFTAWAYRLADRRRLAAEVARIAADAAAEEAAAQPSDITPATTTTELATVGPVVRSVLSRVGAFRAEKSEDEPGGRVEEPPVRINLPPGKGSAATQQKALLTSLGNVLGMPDPLAKWFLRGRHPYVELRPRRLPPPAVLFAGVKRHFEATDIDHPVIGLAPGNHVETIDYANNSPHVLVSGGSGTGKSVLLKCIHAQRMHHGAGLIVLDYKRVSHRWAHNLPGCIYAWKIEHIHDVAVLAGLELERRIANVLPAGDDTDVDLVQFRTIDVLVEEINSLTPQLQSYWASIRETGDPTESPAISAIKRTVNMGREYSMHVHVGAQRGSANIFGSNGGDIRESFQTRLLAKWTAQTWKMLAGGLPFQRCPSGTRGIWAALGDEGAVIVRTPFLTNAQAREWAMSGIECPVTPLGELPSDVRPVPGPVLPELVSLSKALDHLPGPALKIDAIRKAAQRPGFPLPVGELGPAKTYDLEALIAWKMARDEARQLDDQFSLPAAGRGGRGSGKVYRFDCLDEATGAVVCGYVGQTRRTLAEREREHRGDKPWSDLIVGAITLVWESEEVSDADLDAIERRYILDLKPLYNVEHQLGAPHAVPKWEQIEARQVRNAGRGLPVWIPIDVFNQGRSTR